jgi:hypothetical protein
VLLVGPEGGVAPEELSASGGWLTSGETT